MHIIVDTRVLITNFGCNGVVAHECRMPNILLRPCVEWLNSCWSLPAPFFRRRRRQRWRFVGGTFFRFMREWSEEAKQFVWLLNFSQLLSGVVQRAQTSCPSICVSWTYDCRRSLLCASAIYIHSLSWMNGVYREYRAVRACKLLLVQQETHPIILQLCALSATKANRKRGTHSSAERGRKRIKLKTVTAASRSKCFFLFHSPPSPLVRKIQHHFHCVNMGKSLHCLAKAQHHAKKELIFF